MALRKKWSFYFIKGMHDGLLEGKLRKNLGQLSACPPIFNKANLLLNDLEKKMQSTSLELNIKYQTLYRK
jgi:hypothetical protein